MTLVEAAKLAREALEEINKLSIGEHAICLPAEIDTAMDALDQAIAEAEQQKPVAWKDKTYGNLHHQNFGDSIPLYTAPPKREWQGLTDAERNNLWREVVGWGDPSHDDEDLMKAIEAKLKEKNT